MRAACVFLCVHFMSLAVFAQDPHFSQFFASPLTLNPANTGNFDGILRVAGNYRNQWPAFGNAFITSTVSIDGKLLLKGLPENDQLSAGIIFLTDQTGGGVLKQNHLGASIAYAKSLDQDGAHSLTAGFQTVFGDYRFDPGSANFEDELSPSGFTLPSAESFLNGTLSRKFVDINTGILYRGSFSPDDLIYAGGSVCHVNKPVLGYGYSKNSISPRYNIHGGGFKGLGERTTLHASVQYQRQDNFKELIAGTAISQLVIDQYEAYLELFAGMWVRNKDALIPYVGLEWNNIRAGITYDVLLPSQRLSSFSYQSIEISLIWSSAFGKKGGGIKCPKF